MVDYPETAAVLQLQIQIQIRFIQVSLRVNTHKIHLLKKCCLSAVLLSTPSDKSPLVASGRLWSPTSRLWSPTSRLWSPTSRLWSPTSPLWSPTCTFLAPTD